MTTCPNCGDEYDPDEGEMCACMAEAEAARLRPLYEAEKAAGLLRPQAEIDEELRQAGRGHLVRRP